MNIQHNKKGKKEKVEDVIMKRKFFSSLDGDVIVSVRSLGYDSWLGGTSEVKTYDREGRQTIEPRVILGDPDNAMEIARMAIDYWKPCSYLGDFYTITSCLKKHRENLKNGGKIIYAAF